MMTCLPPDRGFRVLVRVLVALLAATAPAAAQQAEVVELMALVWDDGVAAALERYDAWPDDERDPGRLVRLADQLLWTGRDGAALEILARADEEAPGRAEIGFHQGRAHLHRGRTEPALEAFGRGLAAVEADTTLNESERSALANRFRNRIRFLSDAEASTARIGAYRSPDGRTVAFKFDPYVHTFPALVDLASGENRVLYPSAEQPLEWRDGDGQPAGTVAFEEGQGGVPTLVMRDAEGFERRAEALPIAFETLRFSAGGASIEGTLVRPASDGPVPAVVLLHGAGLSTRYNLMHEAIAFAVAGVAALVYDKPGLGHSSGGNWLLLSIPDQAAHAGAAVDLLKARDDIDAVGVWGFSQGGWVAPLAARASGTIDFVITVAGAAVDPQEQSVQASVRRMHGNGFATADVEAAVGFLRGMWSRVNAGADAADLQDLYAAADGAEWGPLVPRPRLAFELAWWRENAVDAEGALEAVAVPFLGVFGELDDGVPPEDNLPPMARALAAAPTGDYTLTVLPGADHQMMVEGDYHPRYFATFTTWVSERFGVPRR